VLKRKKLRASGYLVLALALMVAPLLLLSRGLLSTPTPTSNPPGNAFATDGFPRTLASGWGTAVAGGWWTVVGSPWQWSVLPGAGSVTVSPGAEERAYLSSQQAQDVDVTEKVSLPQSAQSNNEYAYILARYLPAFTPTYYRVGVLQGSSGNVSLRAQRSDGTTLTNAGTAIPSAPGVTVWCRVQVQGVNPATLRAHAWLAGTAEPSTWQLVVTDSNPSEQQPGMVGIRLRNEDTSASRPFNVYSYGASALTGSASAITYPGAPASGSVRYLYVVNDGTLYVYDIANYSLVKQVPLPIESKRGLMQAAPNSNLLYITYCGSSSCAGTHGSLLAYNLVTDQIAWIANYTFGTDQATITPDGKTIYMAEGEDASGGLTRILDASDGKPISQINTGTNGHDYVASLDGSRVYLSGHSGTNDNYVQVVDTTTNLVVLKAGPTINGVRPNTVNGKHTLSFTTSTNTCGFQVLDLTSGAVLYTVTLSGSCSWTATDSPSHGISLSPDEKQVYVMDAPLDAVDIYDVSGLPASAPAFVAQVPLSSIAGQESPCQSYCVREGWVLHSLSGRYVWIGDTGDIIDTAIHGVVQHLSTLSNTRLMIEVDYQNGLPSATTTRFGLGRVTN
jgi:hypothetical protein